MQQRRRHRRAADEPERRQRRQPSQQWLRTGANRSRPPTAARTEKRHRRRAERERRQRAQQPLTISSGASGTELGHPAEVEVGVGDASGGHLGRRSGAGAVRLALVVDESAATECGRPNRPLRSGVASTQILKSGFAVSVVELISTTTGGVDGRAVGGSVLVALDVKQRNIRVQLHADRSCENDPSRMDPSTDRFFYSPTITNYSM